MVAKKLAVEEDLAVILRRPDTQEQPLAGSRSWENERVYQADPSKKYHRSFSICQHDGTGTVSPSNGS